MSFAHKNVKDIVGLNIEDFCEHNDDQEHWCDLDADSDAEEEEKIEESLLINSEVALPKVQSRTGRQKRQAPELSQKLEKKVKKDVAAKGCILTN